MDTVKLFCAKQNLENPDCAGCALFGTEDIRDEARRELSVAGGNFASLAFRLFHRDLKIRQDWRRKVCKHFKTIENSAPAE